MTKKQRFLQALAGYGVGYLYICCFLAGFTTFGSPRPWYTLLFTAAYFLWARAIGGKKAPAAQERLWLGAMGLIAVAIALNRCRAVTLWGVLALHGAAGLWGLYHMGQGRGMEDPFLFLLDGVQAFLIAPFLHFFLRLRDLAVGIGAAFGRLGGADGKQKRKKLLLVCLCVLLALPLLGWTAGLLGQADRGFAALLEKLRGLFSWEMPRWLPDQLMKLLLGLPVAAYLYGLLAGSARAEGQVLSPADWTAQKEKLQVLPSSGIHAVWGLFLGLYLLFFGVQAGNLLAVFRGTVPGTLTAAEYARSGFFQLCLVMGINFCLLWLGWLLASRTKAGDRLAAGILVESLFLAVTAAAKLLLYIRRFGFTPLRLLSAWAVLVLTAGCILAILSLTGRKHGFRNWLYFTVGTFTALCFY